MNQEEVRAEISRIVSEGGLLNVLRGLYDVVVEINGTRTLTARAVKTALTTYEAWYWKQKT